MYWKTLLLLIALQAFIISSTLPLTVQAQSEEVDENALIEQLQALAGTENDEVWEPAPDTEEPEEVEAQAEPVPEETPTPEEEEHDAAEDILNLFGSDFNYAWPEVIEVPLATIEDTSVVIKTTQILYNDEPINQYRVYYSTNTIANFLDVDDLREVDLNIQSTRDNMVELKLEWLNPSTEYFLIVAPVDPTDAQADPLELISDEVTFQTKATTPVIAPTSEPTSPMESWPAANWMYVDDVSYTYADNKATVTWTAKSEASTVALSIKRSNSTTYTKLADVPATAWKYTFTVQEGGLHLLKIETKNANWEVFGKEQIESIKIDVVEEDAPVMTAPQVGPAQNLLYGLIIFAMLVWVWYNFRKQEV